MNMYGNYGRNFWKRKVFKRFLKTSSLPASLTNDGKEFQITGPILAKDLSPNRLSLVFGISRDCELVDLSDREGEYGVKSSSM